MGPTNFFNVHMPYCLYCCEDGNWLVLNRGYTPLGDASGKWCDYENTFPRVKMTNRRLNRLTVYRRGDQAWLYNDDTHPSSSTKLRDAYLKRVGALFRCEVVRED